jgi:hypothetical protein
MSSFIHSLIGIKYAVKRVDTKSIESTKCLLKEVQILSKFCNNTKNIVHFKGIFGGVEFYDDGKPKEVFMMIEYLPGWDMKKFMNKEHDDYLLGKLYCFMMTCEDEKCSS